MTFEELDKELERSGFAPFMLSLFEGDTTLPSSTENGTRCAAIKANGGDTMSPSSPESGTRCAAIKANGGDNELTVRIAQSCVGEPHDMTELDEPNAKIRELIKMSRPLLVDETHVYEIIFEGYIIYQVGNESYCSGDPNDKFSGRFLRVYEKSALLEHLGEFSDAQALDDGTYYPGKWSHYQIVTQNHIISIISANAPIVNVLHGT